MTSEDVSLYRIVNVMISLGLFITYLMGIAIAKGFWLTIFAIIMPFYAWYLVVATKLM